MSAVGPTESESDDFRRLEASAGYIEGWSIVLSFIPVATLLSKSWTFWLVFSHW